MPGGQVHPRMMGRIPPQPRPPLYARGLVRPILGEPPNPPNTVPSQMAIFDSYGSVTRCLPTIIYFLTPNSITLIFREALPFTETN